MLQNRNREQRIALRVLMHKPRQPRWQRLLLQFPREQLLYRSS